ncbi:MAG TPA: fumarylacetoacetate hydrolase family protein [Pirellulaceae bacterium]|nr:fumarylacetoacetate hydrolase family protein [Pirellulaceae bacterium]
MRLCRFLHDKKIHAGFYSEKFVVPLSAAAKAYSEATHEQLAIPAGDDLAALLPPDGKSHAAAAKIAGWVARQGDGLPAAARLETGKVELLVPLPRPNKLFLLAGNYADHIIEGGGMAPERLETFPYVFMKPPSTTLTDPGKPVVVPSISPSTTDWELELAVVIGRTARHIKESEALAYVAGYTIVNDISDRKFRPNPGRKERKMDSFFDWLHGKWHDSFCPCGPCITSADAIADPQKLAMKLSVNGEPKQNASTGQQIFPVAAVIEFISHIVTLEPGDIISTGTPAGVGNATGTYLHAGDRVEAWIEGIGTLVSPVVAEEAQK